MEIDGWIVIAGVAVLFVVVYLIGDSIAHNCTICWCCRRRNNDDDGQQEQSGGRNAEEEQRERRASADERKQRARDLEMGGSFATELSSRSLEENPYADARYSGRRDAPASSRWFS